MAMDIVQYLANDFYSGKFFQGRIKYSARVKRPPMGQHQMQGSESRWVELIPLKYAQRNYSDEKRLVILKYSKVRIG